jgi:spermidine synthase
MYNLDMIGTKILEEKKSKYNGHLRVVRTLGLGTYIQAEGLTQSGGIVASIWRKTLRRILHTKYDIQKALILGLGGGSAAKYVRLYWPDAEITGIDIDPIMIELGKKYLGLGEIGVKIKIEDALISIRDRNRFDLIIIDLYRGDKFPEKFASEIFLRLISKLLSEDGVAAFNRLYYGDKRSQAVKFGRKLQKIFRKVDYFYPEANLMFVCSK